MIAIVGELKGKSLNNNPFVIGRSAVGDHVFIGEEIEVSGTFDYKNLISATVNMQSRSNISQPSYGILSNTSEISLADLDGKYLDYFNKGLLSEGLSVDLWLINTLSGEKEKLTSSLTDKWEYDNNKYTVSISLKDNLEELQYISISGISYNPIKPFYILTNGNMSDLYNWLKDRTPYKYNMISFDELDEETKKILLNTNIQYPLLEDASLWEQWNKLCQVCALYIYKNKNGKTICSYSFGS